MNNVQSICRDGNRAAPIVFFGYNKGSPVQGNTATVKRTVLPELSWRSYDGAERANVINLSVNDIAAKYFAYAKCEICTACKRNPLFEWAKFDALHQVAVEIAYAISKSMS